MFTNSNLILWLSLFPLTYIAHLAEEYWAGGGYSNYLFRRYSVELSPRWFMALQSVGLFLMIAGAALAILLRFPVTMLAMLSAIVLGNSLIHIVRSVSDRTYTPGLVTAVTLWLPLVILTLKEIWPASSTGKLLFALSVGLIANYVVELITFRSTSRTNVSRRYP
ncbi:MAG TPA: HXXEE domain-containing protein [Pyrinomonadaceae bacterium]